MNRIEKLLKPTSATSWFFAKLAICLFLLFCFSETQSLYSQNVDFKTGVIIDSVKVKKSTDTFTLYLPKKFNKNEPASIVFIFDPVGRGKAGIKPFIEAAETYNYILVCSNDSKNGPFEVNIDIVNRLFESVFASFSLNEDRIYTAGFSGGSRLASALAVLSKKITGVIACGAGFSSYLLHKPMTRENFSFVGLIGQQDMNYQEMLSAQDWLDGLQIDNELFINGDGHSWPSSGQILKAFDWLELEAFRKNQKPINWFDVNKVYERFYDEASTSESQNKIESAVWEYQRLQRNFVDYYTLDSISKKVTRLKATSEYSTQVKKRRWLKTKEESKRRVFINRFASEIKKKTPSHNVKWWQKKLNSLREEYLLSEDRQKQLVGIRVSNTLYSLAIESANIHLQDKNYNKSLYCHQILAELQPKGSYPIFLIAKDYAKLNMEDETFEYLERAISMGFSEKKYILNATEFYKYRSSERFKSLIEKMKTP
jgi:hypothetical protein